MSHILRTSTSVSCYTVLVMLFVKSGQLILRSSSVRISFSRLNCLLWQSISKSPQFKELSPIDSFRIFVMFSLCGRTSLVVVIWSCGVNVLLERQPTIEIRLNLVAGLYRSTGISFGVVSLTECAEHCCV